MAKTPNYGQERAQRARDQRMKAQEKVKRREEDAIKRKAERDGAQASDPSPEES